MTKDFIDDLDVSPEVKEKMNCQFKKLVSAFLSVAEDLVESGEADKLLDEPDKNN